MNVDYVRLTEGLADKGILVPITENIYDLIKKNSKKDYYASLYRYNDRHVSQFNETNSVAGIIDVKTNKILFDFDDSQDIENARRDAIIACDRLMQYGVPEDQIRIFFTGNKGFNVETIFDQELSRQEFVNIVFGLASDLKTFDTKINNESRIIRVPLTKHPKSGLYKIPLTFNELASANMKEISTWATEPNYNPVDLQDDKWTTTMPEKLEVLKGTEFQKITDISKNNILLGEIKGFDIKDIDFSQCPRWMSKERFALQEGFFYGSDSVDKGERNSAFMILAATYKAQGFSADHTLQLLCATAEKQAARTGESVYGEKQLFIEIVKPVFSPTWKGGIYGRDEELLVITRKRFDIQETLPDIKTSVEGILDVGTGFKDFAKNMNQNRVLSGLKSLDDNIVMTVGMMCTVVSAPGGGKTALANLLAETVSKNGENVLYFSLDLYKNLLFGRMLQRHVDYDIKKILTQFENNVIDPHLMQAYTDVISSYNNVGFSFKSSSIDDIENEIRNSIETKGKSPKLVIIDYLDKVRSPFTDPTQSSAYVAGRLSDIAKRYNTLVLLLAQPSKFGSSGPEQEFKTYRSLKGSSSIESDSRLILGIHRPGYDPSDQSRDNFSSITILKNNTGPLMRLDYAWDGQAGTFTDLTNDQRRSLKNLRDELESAKVKKDAWDI